jgi:DNA mismatch repair protein MutS
VAEAATPLMQQWESLKAEAKGAWLFFRLGDFYELFGADAEEAAPILDVQLTTRDGSTPMCGVPYHALDAYLRRALAAGRSAAVAEQLEDPRSAKGLVDRGIIRYVTPGTFVPDDGDAAGPLVALVVRPGAFGLAAAYAATGRVDVLEFHGRDAGEHLRREWERLEPAEVILEQEGEAPAVPTAVRPDLFAGRDPTALLQRRLKTGLRTLGIEEEPLSQRALLGALRYLESTQRDVRQDLLQYRRLAPEGVFFTTERTRRQLGVTTTSGPDLLATLDATETPGGARRLKEWVLRPERSQDRIQDRAERVALWKAAVGSRLRLRQILRRAGDPERRLARLAVGVADPRDLSRLLQAVEAAREVASLAGADAPRLLPGLLPDLDPVALLLSRIHAEAGTSWEQGPLVAPGVSAALDERRALLADTRGALDALETVLREETGIRSLKIGQHRTFGLFAEVPRSQLPLVPGDWRQKQTLVSAARFTLDRLEALAASIAHAEEAVLSLEQELAGVVREALQPHIPALFRMAEALSTLDAIQSLAEVADRNGWSRPRFGAGGFRVEGLRHPVVERTVPGYVRSDLQLGDPGRRALITGPNMGGKSTFMRAVALNAWMAQLGGFVAAAAWEQPLLDGIFARVGADDDLARGQSTFMVEMEEMAHILRHATDASLVLLDELGRGTSTFDGLALAWAILEHLLEADPGPYTLFATHYHELAALTGADLQALRTEGVVAEGRLVLLHRVEPGVTSESFGIEVAAQAGIPRSIVIRAGRLLRQWERDGRPAILRSQDQVRLFETDPVHDEIIREIRRLDLTRLTPLEALTLLTDWQRKLP